MTEVDLYTNYYLRQVGSGVSSIYSGPSYQRGYGIGSFLGGLFRAVYPLISKGTKAVGSELLKSGVGLLGDLMNEDPNAALKKRGKELVSNLGTRTSEHLFGKGYGYNGLLPRGCVQSTRRTRRRKTRVNSVVKKRKTIRRRKRATTRKKPVKRRRRAKKSRTARRAGVRRRRSKRVVHDIFA